MAIVTTPSLIVSPPFDYEPFHPLVGWVSLVTRSNVSADSENASYPASNLANISTNLRWESDSLDEQLVTLTDINGVADYVGIARHNFGTGEVLVAVEGILSAPGEDWETLIGPVQLADDAPAVLRFAKATYSSIRLRLTPDNIKPRCAVMYCGTLTPIKPGILPGYVPLPRALSAEAIDGTSESGEHLGSIITGATLASSAQFRDIDPDFYTLMLKPFIAAANRKAPFFFAWSPEAHPDEVAFAWLKSSAQPLVNRSTEEIDLTLDMGGLAL